MVLPPISVVVLHWVVPDIFIRDQCSVYLQLLLRWLSEEALCLFKYTFRVLGIQALSYVSSQTYHRDGLQDSHG